MCKSFLAARRTCSARQPSCRELECPFDFEWSTGRRRTWPLNSSPLVIVCYYSATTALFPSRTQHKTSSSLRRKLLKPCQEFGLRYMFTKNNMHYFHFEICGKKTPLAFWVKNRWNWLNKFEYVGRKQNDICHVTGLMTSVMRCWQVLCPFNRSKDWITLIEIFVCFNTVW